LYCKDSTEFALVCPKDFLEGTPSSTEEDCVEFAIVFKESPQAFGDGKDGVAMGDVFDHFAVDVFRVLHSGDFVRGCLVCNELGIDADDKKSEQS
jgi:hypothetical protein